MPHGTTTLQGLLDEANYDRPEVYADLLRHAGDRLRALAHTRLRGFPALRRWVEDDDVLQTALVRLHKSLDAAKPPTVREFFGLAGLQIQRALIDLHRQVFGTEGVGANHYTDRTGRAADDPDGVLANAGGAGPADWGRFFEATECLPAEERQVVELLFLHGLTQEEAAQVLGVSVRTVKRRWLSARVTLGEVLRPVEDGW